MEKDSMMEWRGGERNAHCQHESEGEEPATWAWLVLGLVIFVFGILGISVTRSAEEAANLVGALAPDEYVFLCRDAGGGNVAVTAAVDFGETQISKPGIADGKSIHCRGKFVDPRDISATGGPDGMLQFLSPKERLGPEVARAASYSWME